MGGRSSYFFVVVFVSLAPIRVIPGSSSNIRVAEQNLDRAEVGAGVEHVCRASMAEQVRMDHVFDARAVSCFAAEIAEGSGIERLIGVLFGWEQPLVRFAPSVVNAQPLQQNRRQRDVSWDPALALAYLQYHLLAVDVAYLQMA